MKYRKRVLFLFFIILFQIISNKVKSMSAENEARKIIKSHAGKKIKQNLLQNSNSNPQQISGLNDKQNYQGSVIFNFPKDNLLPVEKINLNVYNNFLITNSSITQMINGNLNNPYGNLHNDTRENIQTESEGYDARKKNLNEKLLKELISDRNKFYLEKLNSLENLLLSSKMNSNKAESNHYDEKFQNNNPTSDFINSKLTSLINENHSQNSENSENGKNLNSESSNNKNMNLVKNSINNANTSNKAIQNNKVEKSSNNALNSFNNYKNSSNEGINIKNSINKNEIINMNNTKLDHYFLYQLLIHLNLYWINFYLRFLLFLRR